MAAYDQGPLSKYNSLTDKYLVNYFNNDRMRRHLIKSGLITKDGEVIPDPVYRVRIAKREHRKKVRDMISHAIIHKALEMERSRQIDISKQIEDIAKLELVKRVRSNRMKNSDDEYKTFFKPGNLEGKKKPRSQSSHDDCGLLSTTEDDSRRRLRKLLPQEEIDSKHLSHLDALTLHEYSKIIEKTDRKRVNRLPYLGMGPTQPYSGRRLTKMSVTSTPTSGSVPRKKPKKKNTKKGAGNGGPTKPKEKDEPFAMTGRSNSNLRQSLTIVKFMFHAPASDRKFMVTVDQQPSGGNTLRLAHKELDDNDEFEIISKRHKGYPFSLTFYIDGVTDCRLSTCCEHKSKPGKRIGGPKGHFTLSSVKEGSGPCFKCLTEEDIKQSKPKKDKKVKWNITPGSILSESQFTNISMTSSSQVLSNTSSISIERHLKSISKHNIYKPSFEFKSPNATTSELETISVKSSSKNDSKENSSRDDDTDKYDDDEEDEKNDSSDFNNQEKSSDESTDSRENEASEEPEIQEEKSSMQKQLPNKRGKQVEDDSDDEGLLLMAESDEDTDSDEEEVENEKIQQSNKKVTNNTEKAANNNGQNLDQSDEESDEESSEDEVENQNKMNKKSTLIDSDDKRDSDDSKNEKNSSEKDKTSSISTDQKPASTEEIDKEEEVELQTASNSDQDESQLAQNTENNGGNNNNVNATERPVLQRQNEQEDNDKKQKQISTSSDESSLGSDADEPSSKMDSKEEQELSSALSGNASDSSTLSRQSTPTPRRDKQTENVQNKSDKAKPENINNEPQSSTVVAPITAETRTSSNGSSTDSQSPIEKDDKVDMDEPIVPKLDINRDQEEYDDDKPGPSSQYKETASTSGAQDADKDNLPRLPSPPGGSPADDRSESPLSANSSELSDSNESEPIRADNQSDDEDDNSSTQDNQSDATIFLEGEEVSFKRAQEIIKGVGETKVKSLTIKSCDLQSYIFDYLAENLSDQTELTSICISNCELDISTLRLLATYLPNWTVLNTLILSNNKLTDYSLKNVLDILEKMFAENNELSRTMKLLDLSDCQLQENDLFHLVELIQNNSRISQINLSGNQITDGDLWNKLVKALSTNPFTTKLRLENCGLGPTHFNLLQEYDIAERILA